MKTLYKNFLNKSIFERNIKKRYFYTLFSPSIDCYFKWTVNMLFYNTPEDVKKNQENKKLEKGIKK